ncbi:hypothetical protein FSP39_007816 [Pinctada imbricata]|uniref:C-type lectin domain-containing protein n=1 Tax=Pinctada imbricata TaxID=66713 RepID=A0AA89BVY6_PINIB|nr:hypothetical protein FSP39_007816 [Pinctada imbricata]
MSDIDQKCADKIRLEAFMHRFLVFRGQDIPGEEQVRITSLLGSAHEETSTPGREKQNNILDKRLAFLSNDPKEGLLGNGVEGWHSDGNTIDTPHLFTLLYCKKASRLGPTLIVPLKEISDALSEDERNYLEKIHFVSGFNSSIVHPLLYKHPHRNDDTVFLALGSLSGQYLMESEEDGGRKLVQLSKDETQYVMDLLESKLLSANLIFALNYKPGDFLIMNNQAVAHIAGPGTQLPPEVVGVRLIHRSTVQGESKPSKEVKVNYKCAKFSPFDEGYCIFSLKDSVFYPRVGYFDSQPVARQRCKSFNKFADLAAIHSEEWNDLVKSIITEKGHPHWINASNPQGTDIFWGEEKGHFANWDPEQPNDHGGYEDCVVLGPFAKWYDLPCSGPKLHDKANMAPVIVWEDGIRKMLNVYPLCGVPQKHLHIDIDL